MPSGPPPAAARSAARGGPNKAVEPSVLIVGSGEAALPGLEAALQRHRVHVETGTSEAVLDAVMAAAPDLILLIGDAAHDCGSAILTRLMGSPLSSVVPVAILDDNTALDARLRAFRHGAAAVIPRSASVDAIAEQVARVAREIPERGGESLGIVGEATLHEFVTALSNELRSGILTVSAGEGHEHDAVRLVLGSGRPLAHFIDDFVTRVRRHVVLAEPLRYEFDERAGGTVQLLGGDTTEGERRAAEIQNLRLALADDDAARADSVAQELRQHGANVAVTDLKPADVRFARLRQVDPAVVLIGEAHLQGDGYDLIRRMRSDTRLRWASLLVVRWDEVWTEHAAVPGVVRLKGTLAALAEPEHALRERAQSGSAFDTRLEVIGPARCLRALVSASHSAHALRATFHNARVRVEVDISNGLVVGALGQTLEEPSHTLEGPMALAAIMMLSSGRVHVERVQQPATANIMGTIDVALDMADAEEPPLRPSLPVPHAMASSRPPPPEAPVTAPTGESDSSPSSPSRAAGARISVRAAMYLVAAATALSILVVVALWLARRKPSELPARANAAIAVPRQQPKPAETALAVAKPPPAPAPPLPVGSPPAESASPPSQAPPASAEPAQHEPPASASKAEEPAEPGAESSESAPEIALELPAKLPSIREALERAPTCASLVKGEKVQGQSPTNSQVQLRRARRELVRGDLDAAQQAFCLAAQWDKANVDAMTGLSRLLLLRRDARAAAQYARRAAKLKPDDVQVNALLGDALARTGELKAARAAWLASTGAKANDAKSLNAAVRRSMDVASRALEQRDTARAERFYRRAALLDSHSAEAASGLAHALVLIGDDKAAISWARRASLLAPKKAAIRVLVGDVMAQAGDKAAAEKEWREALSLEPGNAEAEVRLRRLEKSREAP